MALDVAQAQSIPQVEPTPADLEQVEPTPPDRAQAEDVTQPEPAAPAPQRRVMQLETDDGVIEITNRARVAPAQAPPPVTTTRRLTPEGATKPRLALPPEPAREGNGGGWAAWAAVFATVFVSIALAAWVLLRRRRSRLRGAFPLDVEADSLFDPGRDSQPLIVGTPQPGGHGGGRQWLSQPPLRGKHPEN
jgi:hypothetical protein